jgi:polyisoprenyl-teichoic acid--peptidoglycan teichoic acid transferase
VAVVLVIVVVAASGLVDRARDLTTTEPEVTAPDAIPGDPQPTTTLVTVADGPDGPAATSIALLAVDRDSGQGTVLLVPTDTVADVPGYGSFRLGEAFGFGGGPLVGVSLDNLLGIRSDAVATVTGEAWAEVFAAVGGGEVTLAEPLVERADDGSGRTVLPAGTSDAGPDELAALLTVRDPDELELDALPRAQAAIGTLLDRLVDDPSRLDALFEDGTAFDTANPDVVRTVLAELATARAAGDTTTLTLPVSPLGTGTEDAYRPDGDRIGGLVDQRLAASRPEPGVAGDRRLQVLNGNGEVGVGAAVAEVLQPAGYRVLLTGNADRFTYEVTRIVVFDEDPDTLAAARDIRSRLGVGEIERSGTPQSVVDVTIVVGDDFPPSGERTDGDATGDGGADDDA